MASAESDCSCGQLAAQTGPRGGAWEGRAVRLPVGGLPGRRLGAGPGASGLGEWGVAPPEGMRREGSGESRCGAPPKFPRSAYRAVAGLSHNQPERYRKILIQHVCHCLLCARHWSEVFRAYQREQVPVLTDLTFLRWRGWVGGGEQDDCRSGLRGK